MVDKENPIVTNIKNYSKIVAQLLNQLHDGHNNSKL